MGFGLGFYSSGYYGYPYYGYPYSYFSYPYASYYPAYDPYYGVADGYANYLAPVPPATLVPGVTLSTARDETPAAGTVPAEPLPDSAGRDYVIPRLLLPSSEAPEALPEREEEPPPAETSPSHSPDQSGRRQP